MVFSGSHDHTLDSKGRVIVPADYRARLGDGLVLAPGQDRCVEIYPQEVFRDRVEELRQRPREDARARHYQRFFMARAVQQSMDTQGRVLVPEKLRGYAGLDRELTIIGNDRHLEIWDRAAWEEHAAEIEPDFAFLDTPFEF